MPAETVTEKFNDGTVDLDKDGLRKRAGTDTDKKPANPDRKPANANNQDGEDWTEQYKVKIALNEHGKAIPQWGFMKGSIEPPYIPSESESSKWLPMVVCTFAAFSMVTLGAMSKFSLRFAVNPQQVGFIKHSLFVVIAYLAKPKTDEIGKAGLTKQTLVKRGLVMGTLALTQLFVQKTLPLSVTAAINSLAPLASSLLACIFLGERLNPYFDLPLLLTAGVGTLVCSKPPFLTGKIDATPFSTMEYVAMGVALTQVFVRGGLMCFARDLRSKSGATTKTFQELQYYDSWSAVFAMVMGIVVNGKAGKVFLSIPDWRLIGLMLAVGLLQLLRPHLATHGASNIPVNIAALFSCFNVPFSVVYSVFLFGDKSVDKYYGYGVALILGACALKLTIGGAKKKGKKGKKENDAEKLENEKSK